MTKVDNWLRRRAKKKTISTFSFPGFLRLSASSLSIFRFHFLSLFYFSLLQQWIKESNRPQACDLRKHFKYYLA